MQRRFSGQRWVRIGLRTAHILASSLYLGLLAADGEAAPWLPAVLGSGALLVAEELYRYGLAWLRYRQAWAVGAKLGLIGLGGVWPEHALATAVLALVIGSVISHAPGSFRQAALWGEPGPCARGGAGKPGVAEVG